MRITHLHQIGACDLIVRLSLERENILELQKCFAKVYFRELLLAFWGTREARNLHQTTRLTLVRWFLAEKGAREWGHILFLIETLRGEKSVKATVKV
jgi:hypothetical protein